MSRTERTYYLVVGSYNLSWSFVGAVYAIFLLDRGLDLFEINVVLATYFIASFCFEVPTGEAAIGRKAFRENQNVAFPVRQLSVVGT